MKALITGISGFVGPYLKAQLVNNGIEIFGIDRNAENKEENIFKGDITDEKFVSEIIAKIKPDFIYHLAGFSSVRDSFNYPDLVFKINVEGTRNILNAMRKFIPNSKILVVSSAIVYGIPLETPILESEPTKEASPYANSRIETERMLVKEFSDLNWIVSRSFNHTGPGQSPEFVIADFCKQAVLIEKGEMEPVIHTGNLKVVRDFSDVRDIVSAYQALLDKGKTRNIYNVGSGKGYQISDLIKNIISCIKTPIRIQKDPKKMRKIDNPLLIANISKLTNDTRWANHYDIKDTIYNMVQYFRDTLS